MALCAVQRLLVCRISKKEKDGKAAIKPMSATTKRCLRVGHIFPFTYWLATAITIVAGFGFSCYQAVL